MRCVHWQGEPRRHVWWAAGNAGVFFAQVTAEMLIQAGLAPWAHPGRSPCPTVGCLRASVVSGAPQRLLRQSVRRSSGDVMTRRPMKMVDVVLVLSSHPPSKAHKQCVDVVTTMISRTSSFVPLTCDQAAATTVHTKDGKSMVWWIRATRCIPGYA